ncbi:MAG: biopolymer transporter ExbD [Thermoanaerobaculaceae bacterium]|nr:biopolymer transporter ExbD [Thermoanaerobaculaceae bacterium]
MKFSRSKGRRPGIDISPLIDVVFQLLLFYAVTTQFVADDRLRLKLPEARTAEQGTNERPQGAEVLVTERGETIIAGRVVAERDLERELRRLLGASADQTVTIRGDRGADYGAVVRVLDAARAVGAKGINMAALKPPESSGQR